MAFSWLFTDMHGMVKNLSRLTFMLRAEIKQLRLCFLVGALTLSFSFSATVFFMMFIGDSAVQNGS